MKTLMNWQVTFSFRPFRVLSGLFVALVLFVVLGFPHPVGNASERPPTVEELSRNTALKAVADVVDERMPQLDAERRAMLSNTIVDEALACHLDPLWALAVGDAESRLDHEAVSPTGARGMFQLIPSTWKAEVKRRQLGLVEKFNVVHNAKVGIGYLCHLASTFKRPDSVLLAYNQGPGVASAVLRGDDFANEEGASYPGKVWTSYKKFLARVNLPTDQKTMTRLARAPEQSVYTPDIQTSIASALKALEPPPRKAKTKAKTAVATTAGETP